MSPRIAYIGAGNFSSSFIFPQLERHDVQPAAVCDLVQDRAQRAAARHGFERVYVDFREMLQRERPEAVLCVGPPRMQHEVGLEVLRAGFPLYVQKPAAPSSEQVREMAEAADEAGVVCHVGFNLRSAPAVRRTREIIATEQFGTPTLMVFRYGLMAGRTWGDAVFDQNVHAVDTILHLLGDWKDVQATPLAQEGVRGYVAAITLAGGALASLNVTSEMDSRDEFIYFEITGRGGHTILSHDGDLRYHRPEADDICMQMGTWNSQRLIDWWGYHDDVANFLAAVRGDEQDRAPVQDTVRTAELCEAILRRLREGGAPQ
ncbi:MAG: Gfo/Idh/MocA family protein [Armatimonadota bacterium]